MGTILKQRYLLATKKFELTDKSLKTKTANPLKQFEAEFKFEELSNKIYREKKPFKLGIAVSGINFTIGTILLIDYLTSEKNISINIVIIFFVLCAICTLITFLFTENVVKLSLMNQRLHIAFFANSPNKEAVNIFLQELKTEQKKYLLNKYARHDPYLSQMQIHGQLQWLWNAEIINNNELDNLRKELLAKPITDSDVGFKFNEPSIDR